MAETNPKRIERDARLRWIPIAKMKVNPLAQREFKQYKVDQIVANFDLEDLGTPTVNERDGSFYLIDGQHRILALKQMGWGDQQIQCWTYLGLTSAEEARKFLQLNNTLAIESLAKFRSAVHAGYADQCEIDRVVRAQGLCVSKDKVPGAIGAVATLEKVYARSGSIVLGRSLRIIRDAYGDAGMEAAVIDGIGMLCQRYNGELDEAAAITRLSNVHGGVNGLLGIMEKIRRATGNSKGPSLAAAAVEVINRGKGGKKLPDWFKVAA